MEEGCDLKSFQSGFKSQDGYQFKVKVRKMRKYNFNISKNETTVVNVPVGVTNKDAVTRVSGASRAYKSYHGFSNRKYDVTAAGRKIYITRVA